jgi:hypothetical protein
MTTTMARRAVPFATMTLTAILAGCGSSPTAPSVNATPTATPAPAQTPATTAIFDGTWNGTTSAGKPVTFRVFSGQLTDLNLSLDLGSGCTYRAFHPDTFDPRDPLFPIDTSGRVAFRLTDIALRTNVAIEFTCASAGKGSFDAPDLRAGVEMSAGRLSGEFIVEAMPPAPT